MTIPKNKNREPMELEVFEKCLKTEMVHQYKWLKDHYHTAQSEAFLAKIDLIEKHGLKVKKLEEDIKHTDTKNAELNIKLCQLVEHNKENDAIVSSGLDKVIELHKMMKLIESNSDAKHDHNVKLKAIIKAFTEAL